MAITIDRPYVDVYIWLPKDRNGYTSNSFYGGSQGRSGGRCGHVAMGIFARGDAPNPTAYVSFWPSEKGSLVPNYATDRDAEHEHTLPDTIIRLCNLDITVILNEFITLQSSVAISEVAWTWNAAESHVVTKPVCRTASCASMVYSLLIAGGIGHPNPKGPAFGEFRKVTKCDAGALLGGYFDGFRWTKKYLSPKAV